MTALPTIHFSTVGALVSIVFTSADLYLIESFIGNYGLETIYLKLSIHFPADRVYHHPAGTPFTL